MGVHDGADEGSVHDHSLTNHPRHLTQPEVVHQECDLRREGRSEICQTSVLLEYFLEYLSVHGQSTNFSFVQVCTGTTETETERETHDNTREGSGISLGVGIVLLYISSDDQLHKVEDNDGEHERCDKEQVYPN